MSIVIIIFNLIIFMFVARVIITNFMNIKEISEKIKNTYQNHSQPEQNQYIIKNQTQNTRQEDNIIFEDTINSNNNPIKEKKGRRSSI